MFHHLHSLIYCSDSSTGMCASGEPPSSPLITPLLRGLQDFVLQKKCGRPSSQRTSPRKLTAPNLKKDPFPSSASGPFLGSRGMVFGGVKNPRICSVPSSLLLLQSINTRVLLLSIWFSEFNFSAHRPPLRKLENTRHPDDGIFEDGSGVMFFFNEMR